MKPCAGYFKGGMCVEEATNNTDLTFHRWRCDKHIQNMGITDLVDTINIKPYLPYLDFIRYCNVCRVIVQGNLYYMLEGKKKLCIKSKNQIIEVLKVLDKNHLKRTIKQEFLYSHGCINLVKFWRYQYTVSLLNQDLCSEISDIIYSYL